MHVYSQLFSVLAPAAEGYLRRRCCLSSSFFSSSGSLWPLRRLCEVAIVLAFLILIRYLHLHQASYRKSPVFVPQLDTNVVKRFTLRIPPSCTFV
jgi:hypothetical protein